MGSKNAHPFVSNREIRSFGLSFGLMMMLAGGALKLTGSSWDVALLAMGPLFMLAFWRGWPGVQSFYRCWMKMTKLLFRAVTVVLLTGFFFFCLTPIALLCRWCGRQFILTRFPVEAASCWEVRDRPQDPGANESQW